MKPRRFRVWSAVCLLPLVATFAGCGGGGSGGGQKLPPPPPQAGAPGTLDSAASAGMGAGAGSGAPGTPLGPRGVQVGEFSLTLKASPEVAKLFGVRVHIISADTQSAAKYEQGGAANYWRSPARGSNVTERSFGNGRAAATSFSVPTVPMMDTIVLVAELAAPQGGNDFRMLSLPLKLDYSLDPAKPKAHPIVVNLGINGWQRER